MSNKELKLLFKRISEAKTFKEFLEGDNAAKAYRRIAKIIHPDIVPESLKKEATVAFANLGILYDALNGKLPERTAVIAGYVIKNPLAKGDICDLYVAESVRDDNVILKIVRSSTDNDLLEREVSSLKAIYAESPSSFQHYVPKLLNSFKASGRRVVILPFEPDFMSLEDILSMHPSGLDFRHIVWMGNRLLSILGYIHRMGIVHGAVLPSHLLYNGTSHDLRLVDWCYSTKIGEKVPARIKKYSGYYPPEVSRKAAAVPGTDLYMMARVLMDAAAEVPASFQAFFDYCTVVSPASRPTDAWQLQDLYMSNAKKLYGPPAYIPLKLKVS